MVDTWFDRSTLFLSYGFTERRCTVHSSRHSIHGCTNFKSLAVFARAFVLSCFCACNCKKGIVSHRLAKSVEFTACAGAVLAYAWSVVPTVNPGVVWCSFLRRP